MSTVNLESMDFYLTAEHDCSYLPQQQAITLFADPSICITTDMYNELIQLGFRRSGTHVYRPRCRMCDACIPIRIPVTKFMPSRGQRRVWKRNQDLSILTVPAEYKDEHFQLYRRYMHTRHAGGGMDNPDPEKYSEFLLNPYIDAHMYEFRHQDRLLAVASVDKLDNALSAVYTFFDPDESARSLGNMAILWQIKQAKRLDLEYIYLGYWIKECQKMVYKNKYRPFEVFRDGGWQTHEA